MLGTAGALRARFPFDIRLRNWCPRVSPHVCKDGQNGAEPAYLLPLPQKTRRGPLMAAAGERRSFKRRIQCYVIVRYRRREDRVLGRGPDLGPSARYNPREP